MHTASPTQVSQFADHWTDAMQYAQDEADEREYAAWEQAEDDLDLDEVLVSLVEGTSRDEQETLMHCLFMGEAERAKHFYRMFVAAKGRAVERSSMPSLSAVGISGLQAGEDVKRNTNEHCNHGDWGKWQRQEFQHAQSLPKKNSADTGSKKATPF